MKELKKLTEGRHVIHRSTDNSQLRTNLSDYVEAKGGKDKNYRIIGSLSNEGGIAIPWSLILDDVVGFGEQLHLRFHECYGEVDCKYYGEVDWYMFFHLNVYNRKIGKSPFIKLTVEDQKKVIVACNELIKCAQDILNYTLTDGKVGSG